MSQSPTELITCQYCESLNVTCPQLLSFYTSKENDYTFAQWNGEAVYSLHEIEEGGQLIEVCGACDRPVSDIENVPCISCGRTDLPLHTNYRCGDCGIEPKKNPKAISTDGCTVMRGKLTTIIYNNDKLIIVLKGKGRSFLNREIKNHNYPCGFYPPSHEMILCDLLEEHWSNSSLEHLSPLEVCGLTSADLFTFTAERNDQGDLISCGPVYGFMGYMVESEIDAMLRDGYCRMQGSGE